MILSEILYEEVTAQGVNLSASGAASKRFVQPLFVTDAVIAVYEVKGAVGVEYELFPFNRFYWSPVVAYESREAYHGRIDSRVPHEHACFRGPFLVPLESDLVAPGVDAYVEFILYFLEILVKFPVEDLYCFYVLKFKFPDSVHRHLGYCVRDKLHFAFRIFMVFCSHRKTVLRN